MTDSATTPQDVIIRGLGEEWDINCLWRHGVPRHLEDPGKDYKIIVAHYVRSLILWT